MNANEIKKEIERIEKAIFYEQMRTSWTGVLTTASKMRKQSSNASSKRLRAKNLNLFSFWKTREPV